MTMLKRLLIALTVSFFLFSPRIMPWTNLENRYFYEWGYTDAWARILVVTLVAVAAAMAYWLVERTRVPRLRRLVDWAFLLVIAFLIGENVVFPRLITWVRPPQGQGWLLVWLPVALLYGGLAVLFFRWRAVLTRFTCKVCLVFSPIVPIVFVQLLGFGRWDTGEERIADTAPRLHAVAGSELAGQGPILFIVFDGWSYNRSVRHDLGDPDSVTGSAVVFQPFMTNLNQLSRSSLVFTRVDSSCVDTRGSLPALIYQREGELHVGDGFAWWKDHAGSVRTTEVPSLFAMAGRHGYRSALLGHYLPYRKLLGKQVDFCRSYTYIYKPHSLFGGVKRAIVRTALDFRNPLVFHLLKHWREGNGRQYFAYWYRLNRQMANDTVAMLRSFPANTLFFCHLPTTHPPYVLNMDRSFHLPESGYRWSGTVRDYEISLRSLDDIVGRIVNELRRNGRYENAMIILTADHTWKGDPDISLHSQPDWPRHVPLVIKCPGQTTSHVVGRKFENSALAPVLELALRGRADTGSVLRLLEDKTP